MSGFLTLKDAKYTGARDFCRAVVKIIEVGAYFMLDCVSTVPNFENLILQASTGVYCTQVYIVRAQILIRKEGHC